MSSTGLPPVARRILGVILSLHAEGFEAVNRRQIQAREESRIDYPLEVLRREGCVECSGAGYNAIIRATITPEEFVKIPVVQVRDRVREKEKTDFRPMKFASCPYRGRRYEDVPAHVLHRELIGQAYTPMRGDYFRSMSGGSGEYA